MTKCQGQNFSACRASVTCISGLKPVSSGYSGDICAGGNT